jgi:outer membrane lipopolysaccharide assembly protein LptE/RlpB
MRHTWIAAGKWSFSPAVLAMLFLTGCGYHAVGSATHLPSSVHTLAVPIFQNKTQSFHAEVVMTQAVVHEFTSRTPLTVVLQEDANADAMVKGTILKYLIAPLTYNSTTGQSSSFLITITASVTVTDKNHKVLFQNPNYIFRQQYESSTDLASFLQEDPAAVGRLSNDFAHTLVSDVLESF